MALDKARELIISLDPSATEICLENVGIDTLEPLLGSFVAFTHLQSLRLGNNRLTSLPDDLRILQRLEFLDLSGNPISSLSPLLNGLHCLKQLRHLYVDNLQDQEEDNIIFTIPSLESFNGTTLTDDATSPPPKATSGALEKRAHHPAPQRESTHDEKNSDQCGEKAHPNSPPQQAVATWPSSSLKNLFAEEPTLGVSNQRRRENTNQHSAQRDVASSLLASTAASVRALPPSPWLDGAKDSVAELKSGLATAVVESYSSEALMEWSKEDTSDVSAYLRSIRSVCFGLEERATPPRSINNRKEHGRSKLDSATMSHRASSDKSKVEEEDETYVQHVLSHLEGLLRQQKDGVRRGAEMLRAKKIILEYGLQRLGRHVSSHSEQALGDDALRTLSRAIATVETTYAGLIRQHEQLLLHTVAEKDGRIALLRRDMQAAIHEIEMLMARADRNAPAVGRRLAEMEEERAPMLEELGALRAEREKLSLRVRQLEMAQGHPMAVAEDASGALKPSSARESRHSPPQAPPSVAASGLLSPKAKTLTRKQLRGVIEEIYASKSKYDVKCAEAQLPRETMEQHMYTYLNQKYGLRHIIIEWVSAIIFGIKRYAAEDNDVTVFGKMLRNEIDEEFRFVQSQLRETVYELLRVYIRGTFPLKGDEDLQAILKAKVAGTLEEDEWIDIVKYMYNNDDAVTVIMRIRDLLRRKQRSNSSVPRPVRRRGVSQSAEAAIPRLSYVELVHLLLNFQLEGHERFLLKVVRSFRRVDTDRNGVVNETEFRDVVRAVDPQKTDREISQLLDLVDPHNNQVITFSECVTYLSADLVRFAKRAQEGNSNARQGISET